MRNAEDIERQRRAGTIVAMLALASGAGRKNLSAV